MLTIWFGNSHKVSLSELRDLAGQYVNNASVTVTLFDQAGDALAGTTWPLTMQEDGTNTGTYTAIIPYDVEVIPNQRLAGRIVADVSGVVAQWDCPLTVKERGC